MRLVLGLLLLLPAIGARADAFDDAYEAVLDEGRRAYAAQRGVNSSFREKVRVLQNYDGEDGDRNQRSAALLRALAHIQALLAQTRANPLSVVDKRRMVQEIRFGLKLTDDQHVVISSTYHPGAPNVMPDVFYRALRNEQLALAGGRVQGTKTGDWDEQNRERLADELHIAGGGRQPTPDDLAELNRLQRGPAQRLRITDIPEAALAAELRLAMADADVRARFEREYAANGHLTHRARLWARAMLDSEHSHIRLTGMRWLLAHGMAGATAMADEFNKAFAWWGWADGAGRLSPKARDQAASGAVGEAVSLAAVGIPLSWVTRLGTAVRTLSAADRATVAALEAKIAQKTALTLEEAERLVTLTGAHPDIVFHAAKLKDIESIVNSGRLAANTERYVYGTRTKIKGAVDQILSGTLPKDATVLIQGGPAGLFRPHDFHGLYSGLKRLAGQQTTSGAGDIIIKRCVWRPESNTLVILEAAMPSAGQKAFYLQNAVKAYVRYGSRIIVFDVGFTGLSAFGLASSENQQLILDYVLGRRVPY